MGSAPIAVTEVSVHQDGDYVSRIRRIVECVAESLGMNVEQAHDTKLAVSEACANALKHGILSSAAKGLKVRFCAVGNTLITEVSSDDVHEELTPLKPEEEPPAGYGITLMRSLTDRVEFLRNGRGLIVRLTKVVDERAE